VGYAVEVAKQAGARRLALFHHDPTHADDVLDRLALEAAELAGESLSVFMAVEGTTIDLAAGGRISLPSRPVMAAGT
jgi:ribonuclease BN (tRNA processing enzyme)